MARHPAPKPEPYKIDNRNRVALSKEAMDALGVEGGDFVTYTVKDGEVRVVKLNLTPAPPRKPS